jgi:hypothetical protein
MKIYHVSQEENNDYDTFSDFVCYAPDEETARNMNPDGGFMEEADWNRKYSSWCSSLDHVKVELIGVSIDPDTKIGLICRSFHAG